MTTNVDDFLAHYGVKGMKWGRKKADSSGQSSPSGASQTPASSSSDAEAKAALRKARAKKVAIGVGILAVAAGTAYVGYQLNKNGSLQLNGLKKPTAEVKKKANDIINQEPTMFIHASRLKTKGFKFYQQGGLSDSLAEYTKAFGHDASGSETFKRYGDNNEKIAASFLDPDGRRDTAGRVIPHEIVIPKSMANGINNLDDVKKKIWPLLSEEYGRLYQEDADAYDRR